ncbi:hypothetical protein [Mycetocola spongiae]|uniref:hypothetical protein n=1 Tax=Mycetocola spongiae TaxID=2859226 RepID=UPI001CF0F764|nr:hypothetical protein [Mycetocola spongiae]UCR88739.1 hypothetical protein KXZ72_12375 [Mycetocola spongiae]
MTILPPRRRAPLPLLALTAALVLLAAPLSAGAAPRPDPDQSHRSASSPTSFRQADAVYVAQPFRPLRDGDAARMHVWFFETAHNTVASAAIHAWPEDAAEPDAAPLAGGRGTLSYPETDQDSFPTPTTVGTVRVDFPGHPTLAAGTRYALVLDTTDGSPPISLLHTLSWTPIENKVIWKNTRGTIGANTAYLWHDLFLLAPGQEEPTATPTGDSATPTGPALPTDTGTATGTATPPGTTPTGSADGHGDSAPTPAITAESEYSASPIPPGTTAGGAGLATTGSPGSALPGTAALVLLLAGLLALGYHRSRLTGLR